MMSAADRRFARRTPSSRAATGSEPRPYRSLNLILTDDDRDAVTENRRRVADAARAQANAWRWAGGCAGPTCAWTEPPADHAFAQPGGVTLDA
jgi:hypothetical protein